MIARVLCLIVFVLEIKGLSLVLPGRSWKLFAFYTQLSNLAATISALLLVIFGQHLWITNLRYLSTCMLIMTILVTICVLIPMGGDPKKLLWTGNGLYHHLLCPIVSTISYIVFEEHAGRALILLPVLITLVYGLIMICLNAKNIVDGPYPFFRVHHQSAKATVLWVVVLMAVVTAASTAVMLVANIF